MPDLLILISTLGGLAAFGVSGLVIGPVVAGFFLTVWEIFAEEFSRVDDTEPMPPEKPDASSEAGGPDVPILEEGAPAPSPVS